MMTLQPHLQSMLLLNLELVLYLFYLQIQPILMSELKRSLQEQSSEVIHCQMITFKAHQLQIHPNSNVSKFYFKH